MSDPITNQDIANDAAANLSDAEGEIKRLKLHNDALQTRLKDLREAFVEQGNELHDLRKGIDAQATADAVAQENNNALLNIVLDNVIAGLTARLRAVETDKNIDPDWLEDGLHVDIFAGTPHVPNMMLNSLKAWMVTKMAERRVSGVPGTQAVGL